MNKKVNSKTDAQIHRMRMRDNMNGIQNAYINDKSTSLKNDTTKPNKQTTNAYIAMMNAQMELHRELCNTYKCFDISKGVDAKLHKDMNDMITLLSNLHLTKADKKAMLKAQYMDAMKALELQMQKDLESL